MAAAASASSVSAVPRVPLPLGVSALVCQYIAFSNARGVITSRDRVAMPLYDDNRNVFTDDLMLVGLWENPGIPKEWLLDFIPILVSNITSECCIGMVGVSIPVDIYLDNFDWQRQVKDVLTSQLYRIPDMVNLLKTLVNIYSRQRRTQVVVEQILGMCDSVQLMQILDEVSSVLDFHMLQKIMKQRSIEISNSVLYLARDAPLMTLPTLDGARHQREQFWSKANISLSFLKRVQPIVKNELINLALNANFMRQPGAFEWILSRLNDSASGMSDEHDRLVTLCLLSCKVDQWHEDEFTRLMTIVRDYIRRKSMFVRVDGKSELMFNHLQLKFWEYVCDNRRVLMTLKDEYPYEIILSHHSRLTVNQLGVDFYQYWLDRWSNIESLAPDRADNLKNKFIVNYLVKLDLSSSSGGSGSSSSYKLPAWVEARHLRHLANNPTITEGMLLHLIGDGGPNYDWYSLSSNQSPGLSPEFFARHWRHFRPYARELIRNPSIPQSYISRRAHLIVTSILSCVPIKD